jgi:hypothetical protein
LKCVTVRIVAVEDIIDDHDDNENNNENDNAINQMVNIDNIYEEMLKITATYMSTKSCNKQPIKKREDDNQ